MARPVGSMKISANIEPNVSAPLDARTAVSAESDLILASNFPYPYVGLPVVVKATGDMWILMDNDVTNIEHWHKIGSGGSGSIVEGYYNETDGKFYEEDTYTTEIVGAEDTLYIALDTNLLYRFDGTDFVVMSSPSTTVSLTQAEFDALPQSEKDNGTTYYITDSSAMKGVCVMGNRFDKANIYTEDEKMVGSYIGKPLYQKTLGLTISADYPLVSGVFMMGNYSLLDANLDIEDMPFVDGFYTDGSDTLSFIDVWYNKSDSKLYFITYLKREDVNAEITIQYTKNNDGTVAIGTGNDYSTDEQIIGTWIDGKRLYQKTLTFDPTITIPQNAWTDLADITALNIEKIVCADVHSTTGQSFPSIIDAYNNKLRGFSYVGSFGLIEAVTIQYTKTTD